jgi:hypothetical protein
MLTADGRSHRRGIVGPSIAYYLSGSYTWGRALNEAGQKSSSGEARGEARNSARELTNHSEE